MFEIPQNNRISIPNSSDLEGNIYYTKNIDLNSEGYIKLADASVSVFNSGDDEDYQEAQSMIVADESLIVLSDDTFKGSSMGLVNALSNQTTSEGAPTPGVNDDVEYFNGEWVITDAGSIEREDGGSWTSISGTPVSSTPQNVLAKFPYQNGLLVGNGNTIALLDTNWLVVSTLILPVGYKVTSMWSVGQFTYIATMNTYGIQGALFKWNGSGSVHQGIWSVDSVAIDSVTRYKDSVACYTRNGQLLYFTGNGFQELAVFPFFNTYKINGDQTNAYENVTHRGMVARDNLIYIAFGDRTIENYPNTPNGVWCYNPKVGLFHMFSGTKTRFETMTVTSGNVNTTTDTLTTASSVTMPDTGTMIYLVSSGATGITSNTWYYIIKVSATEFKVARTYDDAINDVPVDITVSTSTNTFYIPQRLDYGDTYLQFRVGLALINDNMTLGAQKLGDVVFGVEATDSSNNPSFEFCVNHPLVENRGYFVTPKLKAAGNKSQSKTISLNFDELIENDKIVIKTRTKTKKYLPNKDNISATWTSDTVFTTTADLHELSVGDEIEIIGGAGSGTLHHVSSVSVLAGTYTVTLTEANPFVTNGDISYFFADTWQKVTELDKNLGLTYWENSFDVGKSGWIQFKIELQGKQTTINKLIVK